ncbi:DNA alkylation repair protein [Streptomyces caniscabiei]|uniref:DNA alkylation repair protein n=1 Tax=Streptomyces caniscabiei TaxID=2746961 RepID=UPI0029B1DEAD|nr:DNA alkylation repair protein [Streptomyces caniscabiei]MDX2775879.1 DNA alkylation repair protein [Streptomyces caniscabiei]
MILADLKAELSQKSSPEKAAFFPRFFKTGPGQYGEGDQFLGITVPDCRSVAKQFKTLPLEDIVELLHSRWHEERLVALLILGFQYQKADEDIQTTIYQTYLANTAWINNWDLVDLSCRDIVGAYMYHHPKHRDTLDKLAASELLWDRRIAVISTLYFLMKGEPAPTLHVVGTLLSDKHDLIQKASGWMLRELGKRVDPQLLIAFLRTHYESVPRTTLRYAIEHFPPDVRRRYLAGDFS